MREIDVHKSILKALEKMSLSQQRKLLDVIRSMLLSSRSEKHGIMQFMGVFDQEDSEEFTIALKDCDKIDQNDW